MTGVSFARSLSKPGFALAASRRSKSASDPLKSPDENFVFACLKRSGSARSAEATETAVNSKARINPACRFMEPPLVQLLVCLRDRRRLPQHLHRLRAL